MGLKNLLVQIDGGKTDAKRIAAAIGMAQRFDAHLTGLYAIAEPAIPGFVIAQMPAGAWNEQVRERRRRAEAVAEGFRSLVAKGGLVADCRIDIAPEQELSHAVALHARHADLVIMGQADPDAPAPGGAGLIGDVVLECGRPVLAIPYVGPGPTIGEHVLVAWDASREATRALNDALPLLERAKTVSVVAVNASDRPGRHGSVPGADIALHLARHGIKAQAESLEASEIGVGDALLSRLTDKGADLLVMGAYGHSRFREVLLGGVTRQILRSMTVPVLLSH